MGFSFKWTIYFLNFCNFSPHQSIDTPSFRPYTHATHTDTHTHIGFNTLNWSNIRIFEMWEIYWNVFKVNRISRATNILVEPHKCERPANNGIWQRSYSKLPTNKKAHIKSVWDAQRLNRQICFFSHSINLFTND